MYQLNLIDTPGHVDFSYEVSRSLQACEGALLVVDASQGVEAQTLANTYLALHHNLEIIPVINKIDLPAAEPERIREQIEAADRAGRQRRDPGEREARHRHSRGAGSDRAPGAAAQRLAGRAAARADFRFVVRSVPRRDHSDARDGRPAAQGAEDPAVVEQQRVSKWRASAISRPRRLPATNLSAGEVGFIFANIKTVSDAKIGDTIIDHANPASEPLPGFEQIKPMVFAGLVSGGIARARPAARCAGKAAAERQRVQFRAGEFGGAGLRLPLRIPGPAAPGDRAGAAGARVQYRPDHHRAGRALPITNTRRRSDRGRQSDASFPIRPRSSRSKSRSSTPR